MLAPGPRKRSRFVLPTPLSPRAHALTTLSSMAASTRASQRSQEDTGPESMPVRRIIMTVQSRSDRRVDGNIPTRVNPEDL